MSDQELNSDLRERTLRLCAQCAWVACSLPFAAIVLFYFFVLRARLTLGEWPVYNRPDPAHLGLDIHLSLVMLLVPAQIFAALATLWFCGYMLLSSRGRAGWLPLTAAALGFAGLFAIYRYDPGGFWAWFMD